MPPTADDELDGPLAAARDATRRIAEARLEQRRAVEKARRSGHSWAEIGRAIGVSRQAAFKAYGSAVDPRNGAPMNRHTPDEAIARVEKAWRAIDLGDYDELRPMLHDDAARVLDRDRVLGTWAQVAADSGRLHELRDTRVTTSDGSPVPEDEPITGGVVVAATLACEAGDWLGRVALDADHLVVGLLVVEPGTTDLPF